MMLGKKKIVKRFERSNGLDTALYKNYLFFTFAVLVTSSYHVGSPEWFWISIFHFVMSVTSATFSLTLSISLLHEYFHLVFCLPFLSRYWCTCHSS